MIKDFNRWEMIYEAERLSSIDSDSIIKKVESSLESSMGTLYSVPDFETFKRPSEPVQKSILFTNNKFNTFSINYTTSGIYSIDFWKPEGSSPEITLYVNGGESIDDLLPLIPEIAKDPHKDLDIEKIKGKTVPIEEKKYKSAAIELDIAVEVPKPKEEANPKVKEFDDQVSEYIYQDPETIFEDLAHLVDMVIDGTQSSLILTGQAGAGKSYTVKQRIKVAGLEKGKDYVFKKGKSTAAAMYITLYENNGKLIVFDDSDSIFKDDDAVNILKGALEPPSDREPISWSSTKLLKGSTGETIPQTFDFNGRIIFISNWSQKRMNDALKSRAFVLEVALSPSDMVEFIESKLPTFQPEEPMSLKNVALMTIKGVADENKNVEINFRTLDKAIKILKRVKNLKSAKRMIIQQASVV